ncbi:uncharacterized protein LOC123654465 [Melitaea cinxia]|uniref:uncharacterized protein LOC123654465 n=1 Tax=Melitaea cinxia TaxID=113334 RepID=UPI001E26F2CE|nr:uncharacterized protein LOC123654465 [Melitaea cinxia]
MFRHVFTIMGYCCQFDVQYFREQAGMGINLRTGTEVSEAMDIIVNSQRTLFNGSVEDSYEFLYVFDKQDNLTLLNRPITLPPLTYFDVTVNVWAIDSSSDVKALSLDNRKCFLPSDNEVNANSYQGCMTVLMMRKVIGHCRCIPFNYDPKELKVEDFRQCSWERLKCIYKMIDQVQNDIRNIILEHECYQRCDYVQFDTEAEYIKLDRIPIGTAERNTRVTVHFADNTCLKYKREVLYTWDQMLANLGGIFGLCLGGSIISVIELIWFVLGLLFTFCGFKNKVAEKKDTKMVFTLSKKNFTNTPSKFETKKIGRYPFLK